VCYFSSFLSFRDLKGNLLVNIHMFVHLMYQQCTTICMLGPLLNLPAIYFICSKSTLRSVRDAKPRRMLFWGAGGGGGTRRFISIVAVFISQMPVVLVAYFMIVFMLQSYFFVFVFHYVFRTMSDRTLKKFLKSCYIYCKYTARVPRACILLT